MGIGTQKKRGIFIRFVAKKPYLCTMEQSRPTILISNDDGYQAKGINELIRMLSPLADLIVCAPDGARSGYSRAFSATLPLTLRPICKRPGVEIWACNGTPTDCVKMALSQLCKGRKPQMVVGGINHGDNASVNAHYSGTMGVVMEGCMKYIPSVAFSLCDHDPDADFTPLEPYVVRIAKQTLSMGLPKGVCLNVNFPVAKEFRGVKVCRMAKATWANEVETRHHTRGYDYYWMIGQYTNDEPQAEDTDNWALAHGYVAITPTTTDLTAYEAMETVASQLGVIS